MSSSASPGLVWSRVSLGWGDVWAHMCVCVYMYMYSCVCLHACPRAASGKEITFFEHLMHVR